MFEDHKNVPASVKIGPLAVESSSYEIKNVPFLLLLDVDEDALYTCFPVQFEHPIALGTQKSEDPVSNSIVKGCLLEPTLTCPVHSIWSWLSFRDTEC